MKAPILTDIIFLGNNGLHQQYNVEELHNANRMAVMAATAAMVGQGGGVPGGLGGDTSTAAAVQAAAANLAAAMRLGVTQVCTQTIKYPCPLTVCCSTIY